MCIRPHFAKAEFLSGYCCLIFKDVPLSFVVKVYSIYLCILWDTVNNGQPRAATAKETDRGRLGTGFERGNPGGSLMLRLQRESWSSSRIRRLSGRVELAMEGVTSHAGRY